MCSLLHFFQVSFLHPWLHHDCTAAVQADITQRPDVSFYTSGKRVWNPTKWGRYFIRAWQGSKGQCQSAAPCSWCSFPYLKRLWPDEVVASVSICTEGNSLVSTAQLRQCRLGAERLCETGHSCVSSDDWKSSAGPCTIWGTSLNWGLLLRAHVPALAEWRLYLCLLPTRYFLVPMFPCMLVLSY